MIIFLYGPDTYGMKEKLNEIIEGYKKVHSSGLNLSRLDFSKKEANLFSDFKDRMRQASMFQENKLIVISNSFSNANFKEMFLEQGKDFIKSKDIIIFCEEETDKRSALFKFLKKNVKSQEFELLEGQKLKNWITKEFEKYKKKINYLALDKLADYAGNDLWRLSNEIKKLACFKQGKEIAVEDVCLLVKSRIETDIFKSIDAIGQKDKKQALNLLHKHLEKGDSPLYLLSMINYQFRNLLIIKDLIERNKPYYSLAKKTGLHPFVVKKSYYQCQQFSLLELKKIYQKIFQADLDIKTGKIEPEAALELLITEI